MFKVGLGIAILGFFKFTASNDKPNDELTDDKVANENEDIIQESSYIVEKKRILNENILSHREKSKELFMELERQNEILKSLPPPYRLDA